MLTHQHKKNKKTKYHTEHQKINKAFINANKHKQIMKEEAFFNALKQTHKTNKQKINNNQKAFFNALIQPTKKQPHQNKTTPPSTQNKQPPNTTTNKPNNTKITSKNQYKNQTKKYYNNNNKPYNKGSAYRPRPKPTQHT